MCMIASGSETDGATKGIHHLMHFVMADWGVGYRAEKNNAD